MSKKDLILGRCKEKKGYTIFKNTNEDIVNKIKNRVISEDELLLKASTFDTHNRTGCKIVQKLSASQNLCIDDQDKNFILTDEEIKRYYRDNFLQEINNEFDLPTIIEDSLGDLYSKDGMYKLSFIVRKENRYDNLFRMAYRHVGINFEDWEGISLREKTGEWGSMMFCYLNEDGNIVNRDYNVDLAHYLDNKPITKADIIKKIIKKIPDVPYKNYKNKWFAEKIGFELSIGNEDEKESSDGIFLFSLKNLVARGDGTYKPNYGPSYKIPKSAIDTDRNSILKIILPLVNKLNYGGDPVDISEYLDAEKEVKEVFNLPVIEEPKETPSEPLKNGEKRITINGIEVTYNLKTLIAEAISFEFEGEDEFIDDCDAGDGYQETEESFNAGIEEFVENIKKLNNESYLKKLFQYVHITKKGELAKNSNHAIITSNVVMDYSNYYGSHKYKVPAICVASTGVKKATLICTKVGVQDSF